MAATLANSMLIAFICAPLQRSVEQHEYPEYPLSDDDDDEHEEVSPPLVVTVRMVYFYNNEDNNSFKRSLFG